MTTWDDRILDQEFLCASHSPLFEQEGLQQFNCACSTNIRWGCGRKTAYLLRSQGFTWRGTLSRELYSRMYRLQVSSVPGSDFDDLSVKPEATIDETSGGSWVVSIFWCGTNTNNLRTKGKTVMVLRAICKFFDIPFIKWWNLISFLLNITGLSDLLQKNIEWS